MFSVPVVACRDKIDRFHGSRNFDFFFPKTPGKCSSVSVHQRERRRKRHRHVERTLCLTGQRDGP